LGKISWFLCGPRSLLYGADIHAHLYLYIDFNTKLLAIGQNV
jgi:hypothetical protein